MSRENSPHVVGEYWLDKRRDGKSPYWQIATAKARTIIYRSTGERDVELAKAKLDAFYVNERSKQKQAPEQAQVVPILWRYWLEKGRKNANSDQTSRSLRTFTAFLIQDDAGPNAVITDMLPALFERFREWRMGPHSFKMTWDGEEYDYSSEGVAGDTVDRNLNDIRAAFGHAEENQRIPYAPKIKAVPMKYLNPLRERVLTEDELARIFWYSSHFPALFRFVALQMCTSVRPEAAKAFNPITQYNDRTGLIDLQPEAAARTKKRNAIIPAIRPMRVVLRAWQRDGYSPVKSNKTAWRTMRKVLELSDDVHAKTIRHTIATWLYADGTVPERQISEMLGHEGKLSRTTQLYAKYDPNRLKEIVRALTMIWLRISKLARAYAADQSLTIGKSYQPSAIARRDEKC
ncbi:tyrosine-type recombinase/integrase [Allosphingosinicella flava]|uniref:Tyrosine-type recombinase/integrase n=1 Tax=Allosphingosinicella flava TaxID=2771430 RepID=A0A7T2GKI9_9SPHN|nr:tyrosine-type recombinase/integrase [Sphingosinicella flava]QPQ55551.1 tyrosine-type recombinase/integrase [Sphingosinicella flava]